MRQRFEAEPDLGLTPIEKIVIPLKSRDELPPRSWRGCSGFGCTRPSRGKFWRCWKRRCWRTRKPPDARGMELWQILVLGVVRLGLDADWDRMEHIANYDALVRQMLGVAAPPWGEGAKVFAHQTLRDNVALLDAELLKGNQRARGRRRTREVFAKKGGAPLAALELKVDTYVLETDVHFPTDLNLLWDAGRKVRGPD